MTSDGEALLLEPEEFEDLFDGSLSDAQFKQAELALHVVDGYVRGVAPDADEVAAKQVVFEVVRDAVIYGHLAALSSFQNMTSRRQEAGTFADLSGYLSARHKQLLGVGPAPQYCFKADDY